MYGFPTIPSASEVNTVQAVKDLFQEDSPQGSPVETLQDHAPLQYLRVGVTRDFDWKRKPTLEVTALHDTGCTVILLSVEALKANMAVNSFDITTSDNLSFSTAVMGSGASMLGWTKAFIVLYDRNNKPYPLYTKIYLASGLSQDMFIGSNLHLSRDFYKITSNALYFKSTLSYGSSNRSQDLIEVPFVKKTASYSTRDLSASNLTLVPAHGNAKVMVECPFKTFPINSVVTTENSFKSRHKGLQVFNGSYDIKRRQPFTIVVMNTSDDDIVITPKDIIAKGQQISPDQHETFMMSFEVKEEKQNQNLEPSSPGNIRINNINITPFGKSPKALQKLDVIESHALHHYPTSSDSNSTECNKDKEAEKIMEEINKKGYYEYTPTDAFEYLEDTRSYNPPSDPSKEYTPMEIFEQMKTDHLCPTVKKKSSSP